MRVAALAGVLALAACSGEELTRTFGLTRDAPDEFQVTTRAPLSMPPDFTLRPPQPGASRPQELTQQQQAEAALVPDTRQWASNRRRPRRASRRWCRPRAARRRPDIRARVNSEAALDTPSRSFADRLMFWRPAPPAGTAVDPARESQRLRQNAALGQPVEAATRRSSSARRAGLFSGLF